MSGSQVGSGKGDGINMSTEKHTMFYEVKPWDKTIIPIPKSYGEYSEVRSSTANIWQGR